MCGPRVLFNPDLISSHFYVPGLVGIILQLVTVMLTAFAVVRERERGTLEQLSVTPVSRLAIIVGKLIPYAVIGMVQTVFRAAADARRVRRGDRGRQSAPACA